MNTQIPYGHCHCGCGQFTSIAKQSNQKKGVRKGEPHLYCLGHYARRLSPKAPKPNPTEFCLCGCGQRTGLAAETNRSMGHIKGHPIRYISGHNGSLEYLRDPKDGVNPSGLCRCGCGKSTPIARTSITKRGIVKGQPIPYIKGHSSCKYGPVKEPVEIKISSLKFPYGQCQCGCGNSTPIAKRNQYAIGHKKGEPMFFIRGHVIRTKPIDNRKPLFPDGLNRCSKCKERKPSVSFGRAPKASNGLTSHCKDCMNKQYSKWQKANPDNCLRRDAKSRCSRRYGLNIEQYDELLSSQNGYCAICRCRETRVNRTGNPMPLSVDHCHKTGIVRGLLCKNCNTAIGLLQDSVNLLKAAGHYLQDMHRPPVGSMPSPYMEPALGKHTAVRLKHKYKIGISEYLRRHRSQNGLCAICRNLETRRSPTKTQPDRKRLLCVDHDHDTGHVRGLLCSRCNTAIGFLDDDPETVAKACQYILLSDIK